MQKEIERFRVAYNQNFEREKETLTRLLSMLAMKISEHEETLEETAQKLRARVIANAQDHIKPRRPVL